MAGLGYVYSAVASCDWYDWKDVYNSFASIDKIWISLLIDF